MKGFYLKLLVCAILMFFMVFGPMSLTITATPSGLAYAQDDNDQGEDNDNDGEVDRSVAVPEPSTWLLIATGAGGLALFRKKLKK